VAAPIAHIARKLIRAAAVLCCAALLWFVFTPASGPRAASPFGGAVDLSAWAFERNPTVSLSGEWRFFDGKWSNEIDSDGPGSAATMPGPWPASKPSSS
jgi:hypothetical protein